MPESGVPERIVSREDIAVLAGWFDRYAYAFDPLSVDAKEARSIFEDRVRQIFAERVQPYCRASALVILGRRSGCSADSTCARMLCEQHRRKGILRMRL